MCPRGRCPMQVKDVAMSMIVSLRWGITSTNRRVALREAMTPQFEAS